MKEKDYLPSDFISEVNKWKRALTEKPLPPKYEFKPPRSVFPFAPHPRQEELDAQKAIPSLIR